jgi:hypothetical protein
VRDSGFSLAAQHGRMEMFVKHVMLAAFLTLSSALFGQTVIPAGTILPVQLNSALQSENSRPGQVVSARIMQDIPLPGGSKIKSGSKLLGSVVMVQPTRNGTGGEIAVRFDTVVVGKRRIPVTTNLRALASMMEVDEAQVPETGPDRGTSEFDWNTIQIGGEAAYHGSVITNGFRTVGKSVPPTGALVELTATRGKCRANLDSNNRPQATWVFGSNACGFYGFSNLMLTHAGRSNPVGGIVLSSDKGNVKIPAGSGMLVRVN